MSVLKSILNFFIFRRIVIFRTTLSEDILLKGIQKCTRHSKNTEGKMVDHGFEMFYLSDFLLFFPAKLPVVDVDGLSSTDSDNVRLTLTIKINILQRIILGITIPCFVICFLLDKYTQTDLGGISDSSFTLLVIPFLYFTILIPFLIETDSCINYFKSMIRTIERHNENAL